MKRAVLILICLAVIFTGCKTTYYGKNITVKVKNTPKDEFTAGDFVGLGYENTEIHDRDAWKFAFLVYKNNKLVSELEVLAESVGTRRFYLKEKRSKGDVSVASFDSEPTYEYARDRVIALFETRSK